MKRFGNQGHSRTWKFPNDLVVPKDFQQGIGGNEILSRILLRRGITTIDAAKKFMDPNHYQSTPPSELPDATKVASLILKAISDNKRILVWGDFDVDGQTATTLLVSALRILGASVNFYIPVRSRESHGIHPEKLNQFIDDGTEFLLTCDTGISANAAAALAKSRNVPVVITDHHELPEVLPDAQALVNPKFLGSSHPLYSLPGVGVAYKLIEEIFAITGHTNMLREFLDLVALGIVADVAFLAGETRYLLQQGLVMLNSTKRVGLQALFQLAELDTGHINEDHIAYRLAPRMNAIGRMDDANSIVEFLTTDDPTRAKLMAIELEGLNVRRKLLTDQVFDSAINQINRDNTLLDYSAIVLDHPSWPGGIVGIVASKLVEQFHKPVVLICSPSGEIARGSARSIDGIDITDAIRKNSGLLESYGGHPRAAGLAIKQENIQAFRLGLSSAIAEQLHGADITSELIIDGVVNFNDLTMEFANEMERLAPFGSGNPPPIFVVNDLEITKKRRIGRYNEHLILTVMNRSNETREILWWQALDSQVPDSRFDLALTVKTTNYNGRLDVSLQWVESQIRPELINFEQPLQTSLEFIDLRASLYPEHDLEKEIEKFDDVLIWAEGVHPELFEEKNFGCHHRKELKKAKVMVVWSAPPSRSVFLKAIEAVQPELIYLVSKSPPFDDPKSFMERLTGLVKTSLHRKNGVVNLTEYAALSAHTEETILAGLSWLQSLGKILFTRVNSNELIIQSGDNVISSQVRIAEKKVVRLLEETSAYREFFRRTRPENLQK